MTTRDSSSGRKVEALWHESRIFRLSDVGIIDGRCRFRGLMEGAPTASLTTWEATTSARANRRRSHNASGFPYGSGNGTERVCS